MSGDLDRDAFMRLPWDVRESTPHEVTRDDVECIGFVCGLCGHRVDMDGDSAWHREPELNPSEDEGADA